MSENEIRTKKEIEHELRQCVLRIHQIFNDEVGSSYLLGYQTALEWVLKKGRSAISNPET